jgi:CRISPR-associated exonuclease Cas4
VRIKKIKIENWRSIKSVDIDANALMVVIGQNNHGKSNLLSAILFFFGEIKHQDLDFNHGSAELYVELTFCELGPEERTTFKKYLTSENCILIRKTAYLGGNFEYRGYFEVPSDEWLRESSAVSYLKREIAKALPFCDYLPEDGRLTKQIIIDAQQSYIAANRSTLSFVYEREETNFLGLKNVAKGIFGDVFFIPAVREASEDFSTKETSAFGRLFSDVISLMSESNSDWRETRARLAGLFEAFNKVDADGNPNKLRPVELGDFEEELSRELSSWGASIDIEIAPPDIESVFRATTQVWVDDGVRTDIRRKGHGLQRALTVALVRVIANRTTNTAQNEGESDSSRKPSKSRYFIFEEPELYLHPQAQRALFDSFVNLSEIGNQVLLCTHSAGLIDVERYKSIYIAAKQSEVMGTKIRQCNEELFDGDAKKNFNLAYWINPDRGELFFATKVLLVEGPTDCTVIPYLAKILGVFRYDYTIIDCGSKDSIQHYIRLLNKFSIPYFAIYDRDHQTFKNEDAKGAADSSTKKIEDEIVIGLGTSIVFENDIEEEIGAPPSAKNKPYAAMMHVSEEGFNVPQGIAQKIRKAYDS